MSPHYLSYILSCMLDGARLNPGAFFARQLHSAATSTKGRIVLGGFVITISCSFNVIPYDDDDRVPASKRLDKATFELMSFVRLRLVGCVRYTLGVGLYHFLT